MAFCGPRSGLRGESRVGGKKIGVYCARHGKMIVNQQYDNS